MRPKVIDAEVTPNHVIHIEDNELPPGKVKVVILMPDAQTEKKIKDISKFPFGGHKADWESHDELRRINIYKDR